MLPWFQLTVVHLGLIPIQVWGFFVALGILCATLVASKKAVRDGLHGDVIWDLAFWILISAFVGARLFELVYFPSVYFVHPLELLKIWQGGYSEAGGFVGAIIGLVLFFRFRKLPAWSYAGCVAYGLSLGFGIGRIGCFLIHDHPGTLTHFLLGVKYPDGIRHDHGLYLSIEGFLLFILFVWLDQKKANPMTFVSLFLVLHGVVRFFLDFLRIGDVRYLFLTPAQFLGIGMILAGAALMWYSRRAHRV